VSERRRPTKAELAVAEGRTVPDLIGPGLAVVFVGINPGLYSAAVGHHFARPGNRFWPALHAGGWTDRVLSPFDERELLGRGVGIVNLVERATVGAGELNAEEFAAGGRRLVRTLAKWRPRCAAVLGVGAYRAAFGAGDATVGEQPLSLSGCRVWVLPNPSGLNAHYRPADFARLFGELREAMGVKDARRGRLER
jgi:TDG/mug DNA glycosylase family protein